jgi:hypothetical protein
VSSWLGYGQIAIRRKRPMAKAEGVRRNLSRPFVFGLGRIEALTGSINDGEIRSA